MARGLGITVASYGTGLDYYAARSVPCVDLGIADINDQGRHAAWRTSRFLASIDRPDLVVANEVFSSPAACRALRHKNLLFTHWFFSEIGSPESDRVYEDADGVVLLDFPEAHAIPAEIDVPVYFAGPAAPSFEINRQRARKQLGVPQSSRVVVMTFGSMHPDKFTDITAMLAKFLPAWDVEAGEDDRLLVLAPPGGPWEHASTIQRKTVQWVGVTARPEVYYRAADLVIAHATFTTLSELARNGAPTVGVIGSQNPVDRLHAERFSSLGLIKTMELDACPEEVWTIVQETIRWARRPRPPPPDEVWGTPEKLAELVLSHVSSETSALSRRSRYLLPRVEQEAVLLLKKAKAAHGGAALDKVTTVQRITDTSYYGPQGVPVAKLRSEEYLILPARRALTLVKRGDQMVAAQRCCPDSAHVWTPDTGAIEAPKDRAAEMRAEFGRGVFGLRHGGSRTAAAVLGEQTWNGLAGTAVRVNTDGAITTYLLRPDGQLLAERYQSQQEGERLVVYREFSNVEGVALPTRADVYVSGEKFASDEYTTSLSRAEAAESAFCFPAIGVCEGGISPQALEGLRRRVTPLNNVQHRCELRDLEAFGEIIGDSRIVALGEATHGTSEFFKIKHRMVRFLAETMGFGVLAIEASTPEARRVDDYVTYGEGCPEELLGALRFPMLETREMLDTIEWIRAFNASGAGTLRFAGFDMQSPDAAARIVNSFLADVDPDLLREEIEPLYELICETVREPYGGPNHRARALDAMSLHEHALAAQAHMEANEEIYSSRTSRREAAWAVHNARIVAQAAGFGVRPLGYRDRCMADNVGWILEQNPEAKVVLWAHNVHVQRDDNRMGGHLTECFGERYAPIGLLFYEGTYTAAHPVIGLITNVADPALGASVEGVLHKVGSHPFLVDLRKAESSSEPWLAETHLTRNIGTVAVDGLEGYAPINPVDQYRALVFFDRTHASDLIW
jgi:erythromycin esterase